jgi:hypothetical protein
LRDDRSVPSGAGEDESDLIFPHVPPTLEFIGPKLDFGSLLQVILWPDIQVDRFRSLEAPIAPFRANTPAVLAYHEVGWLQVDQWNCCTDLVEVMKRIKERLLKGRVLDDTLTFSEEEQILLDLSRCVCPRLP